MTAYVVVEPTVKNTAAKDRHSSAAGPVLKQFGGEFIAGDLWNVLTGEPAFTNGFAKTEAGKKSTLGMQAIKRIAQPDDIAGAIAFLASHAGRWVNGSTLRVEGGRNYDRGDRYVRAKQSAGAGSFRHPVQPA